MGDSHHPSGRQAPLFSPSCWHFGIPLHPVFISASQGTAAIRQDLPTPLIFMSYFCSFFFFFLFVFSFHLLSPNSCLSFTYLLSMSRESSMTSNCLHPRFHPGPLRLSRRIHLPQSMIGRGIGRGKVHLIQIQGQRAGGVPL